MEADATAGHAALGGYEDASGKVRPFPALVVRVRAALTMVEGETSRAVAILRESAGSSIAPLQVGGALHDALRAGAEPRTIAPALEAALQGCDYPIAVLLRRLGAAMAAPDADALLTTATGYAEIGAWLWAAESAALAAHVYGNAGREDSARRALALSSRFLESCEKVWSPVLASLELEQVELTRREQEIVALAANGASNAEIAERLVLSVRTVESHLYRAMRKLGVSSRQERSGG